MKETKIPIRIEDLTPIANWLVSLLKNNQADFEDFSSDFSTANITLIEDKISAIDLKFSSKIYIGELVLVTKKINENMLSARPLLLKLEGYVLRSKENLNVTVNKFDFSGVRKCINGSDAEGLKNKLTTLMQLTEKNTIALESKGLKAEIKTGLNEILTNNTIYSQDQNDKMLAKEKAVLENGDLFLDLWKDCQNIMDAGKRIYKYSNPEMVKNYTKTHILKTMRHDTEHKAIENTVIPVNEQ